MGAKAGKRKDRGTDRQRLGLILFGAIFVLLFVGFAIAEGLTGPSVPAGDVAHISGVPGEISNISEEKLRRSVLRSASSGGQKKAPKPGSDKYEEIKTKSMAELIEGVWIRGQAEEFGVSVTEKQVEDELATVKKQNFPTDAAYKQFLEKSHFSQEEVNELIELQILTKEIQERVNALAPKPSSAAIEAYYEAEKATQFTTKGSRDVRIILNEDKGKVEAAKSELEEDSTPANWKKVAARYSTDPNGKAKGGLQEGVSEEFLEEPLKAAIFESATAELVGPVKVQKNWILIEVVKLNPEKEQSLAEAKGQIESTLGQQAQQEYLAEFVVDFETKWQQRTQCADGFVIERCANYKGDGHPSNASPACYEADPKTPAKECPAPVTPTSPALPGTVTEAKPKGEPFQQRPLPESAVEEQGEVVNEAPAGAAPPPSGETAPPPSGE